MKTVLIVLIIFFSTTKYATLSPINLCGGSNSNESYISIAEIGIKQILHPVIQENRNAVGLGHLSESDFNLLHTGNDCTNILNHLETFELKDTDEIHPLQKPVFYKADEFYFVFYITPSAFVEQQSDGTIQIQGRISGRTTVLVFNSQLQGVTLFVL